MRVADDARARVPFALVGVVLLVGSAAFAAAVGTRAPSGTNAPTKAAEEATAIARTALQRAVARAGRRAANSPLLAAANTTAGRGVDNATPFRDYVRIRAYLAAQRSLERATARVGDARATVTLPPVSDARSLRAAKHRVRLRRLPGDRPRVAVTFRNVSVTVRRDGRVVERRQYAPTVAVETPVLALHRQSVKFERRLTRSPTRGGLAARLTAKLAATAWARGLAQYGGAPVANVVATRHLELLTNGALLELQREVFGVADPAARRARDRASVRVGVTDLLAGAVNAGWSERVLGETGGAAVDGAIEVAGREAIEAGAGPLSVGVNRTADTAFLRTIRDDLDRAIGDVYSAEAHLRTRKQLLYRRTTGTTAPDGEGWSLVGTQRETTTTNVTGSGERSFRAPPGGHRLASFARTVTTRTRTVRTWRRGTESRRTATVRRTRHLVRIAVVGSHAVTPAAPRRGIDGAHRPGGPLDGRNFAGVRERAVGALVERRGGIDALARRVANGSARNGSVTIDVSPPSGIREWVYRDLVRLRERVRAVSVAVDRRRALVGSPHGRLLEAVRQRREALIDAPETYPSVATKARVAARAAYLDRVEARLHARSEQGEAVTDRLEDSLGEYNLSLSGLLGALDPPRNRQPATAAVTSVRGEPPYLTASVVGPRHTDAVDGRYYPLVARNRNLFATPHGDLAATVAETVLSRETGTAGLRTAGRALRAANSTLGHRENDTLRRRRARLRRATAATLDTLRSRLRSALVRDRRLRPSVADRAVAAGLRQWDTVHRRALAAENGSLAGAVANATPVASGIRRDRLAVRLRVALGGAVRTVGVDRRTTTAVRSATTEIARAAVAGGVEAVASKWVGRAARPPLSGLPLLPVPGWWYATLNVWTATVRGRYARFAVSSRAGSPVPSQNVTYVRRAATVRLDVDGDGLAERLGRNRPVSFAVETAVPVVVPAGPPGVGDGARNESSPGWPRPGPK